jgi:hypothetical protein
MTRVTIVLLAIFTLFAVSSSPAASQAAEKPPFPGTWKVGSVKLNGEALEVGRTDWLKMGALWRLKKDGTGIMGATDITKWSYSPEDEELVIHCKTFGIESRLFTAGVKVKGDKVRLKYTQLGQNWEVELGPDD